MSRFYGTAASERAKVTKCGEKSMKTSCQSYDGSVIVDMFYNNDKKLIITIATTNCSDSCGRERFRGTLEELEAKLSGEQK